jgi:(R,R)-butanediol dehydrogenase/meso-butanediol dehydrogenase/diacetyl reductase
MRVARIVEKGKVELVEAPEPEPGPGQVRIRMLECGICGSDLHAYRGEWAGAKTGHEICGIVDVLGEGVDGPPVGTRICAECFGHCGECDFCRAGDYNLCESVSYAGWQDHGHLADKTLSPATSLFPVPEEFSDTDAMMVEPLAVAFRAVVRAGPVDGASVAVLGAGTIGLLCAAVAKARGAEHVRSCSASNRSRKAWKKPGSQSSWTWRSTASASAPASRPRCRWSAARDTSSWWRGSRGPC